MPPMVPSEDLALIRCHPIVPVEVVLVDPILRTARVERPQMPTVRRCGGPLEGLDDELLVVHVDLVGEPPSVGLSTERHEVLDRGCALDDDRLDDATALTVGHGEGHGTLLSDMTVLRPRDQVEKAVVGEDAVLLNRPDGASRHEEPPLAGRPHVDDECYERDDRLGGPDGTLPHGQVSRGGDALHGLLRPVRVGMDLDLNRFRHRSAPPWP